MDDLDPSELLRLRSYVGEPDAPAIADVEQWVKGLEPWGRITCIRAAHSAVLYAEQILSAKEALPPVFANAVSQLVTAIDLWLQNYREPRARKMLLKYQLAFESEAFHPPPEPYEVDPAFHIIMAVLHLFGAIDPAARDDFLSPRLVADFSAASAASAAEAVVGIPRQIGHPSMAGFIHLQMRKWLESNTRL